MDILLIISFILLAKIILDHNKDNWFLNLKPDDKIKVRIKNKYNKCVKIAHVDDFPSKNRVKVKFENDEIEKCQKCALSQECKYNVTIFKKGEVLRVDKFKK